MNPIIPSDTRSTASQLDRRYRRDRLVRALIDAGVREATNGQRISFTDGFPHKNEVVRTYMRAISNPQAPATATTPTSKVEVVPRGVLVKLTGTACNETSSHTIGIEKIDGDRIRFLYDADELPDDTDKFHTTITDLKAVLAALEN
jgi:hypothetical protein